ncbi:MAG TPA: hypothetical protein DEB39_10135 [Planctomycetaceae bacterium]|nr:hypothetical protein [Planctomycetaceae bacterium]
MVSIQPPTTIFRYEIFHRSLFHRAIIALIVSIFLVAGNGCRRGPKRPADLPELTPCTVVVTFGEKIMEGVGVYLTPADKAANKWGAGGVTNAEGKADLITSSLYAGAVPGDYVISFKKQGAQVGTNEPPSLIPRKYTLGRSKETMTVKTDQREYVFALEGLE